MCGVRCVVCGVVFGVCGVLRVVCGMWCVWGVRCVVCVVSGAWLWCVVCGVWCVVCGVLCRSAALHAHPTGQYFACAWTNFRHSSVKNHRTNWLPHQLLSSSSDRLQNSHCTMSAAVFHSQSPCAFLVSPVQATLSVDLNVAVPYKSQNSLLCNFYSPLNM